MEPIQSLPVGESIFDTHAHYDDAAFDADRKELLASLPARGVCGVITCGCDRESSLAALRLAETYSFVYVAVGIHPENLSSHSTLGQIRELAAHPKCVAIGEIGLDYHWSTDDKPEQLALFEAQLRLAQELDLPVIVHDRDAHADTLRLLQKIRVRGVVHCFSGSPETAEELLKLGMSIGIGGVLTFANAKKVRQVAEMLPADRILLETDAPYLAPVPFRGKTNRSDYIAYTARVLAECRGCDPAAIFRQTRENAERLFLKGTSLPSA